MAIRMSRWLSLASMLALAAVGAPGCAEVESQEEGVSDDAITEVEQTEVKRQSIGNCWLYATSSWLESLHKGATGESSNTSESWLTYWHWFDQLSRGGVMKEISTGGSYRTAARIIERYGLMKEGDFLPAEADAEMSNRQKRALDSVNASLKNGRLADAVSRRDRAAIRKELDLAWGLDASQKARMDAVFGPGVDRTLDRSKPADSAAPANKVIRARDFKVRLTDPKTHQPVTGTLADAIGASDVTGARRGTYAFNTVSYPYATGARREFWKRVQRALHDQVPVIMSWKVDFNALTRDSRFSLAELNKRGPGNQGGHMTVMDDYQAQVPGVGLLKAGKAATKDQMDKALADGTVIQFIRVKNSWGGIRPDRWDTSVVAGYHDLEMAYLNGPIKECEVDEHDVVDTKNCPTSITPLWDATLPPGY